MKKENGISRRSFMAQAGIVASAPVFLSGCSPSGKDAASTGPAVCEPAREIPVADLSDVVVCGGGPAGIAAAIAAGRKGASVTLLEGQGCLGGLWTAGLLSSLLDYENKTTGLLPEIIARIEAQGGRAFNERGEPTKTFDGEIMKLTLEAMCAEAGVKIHFHTGVSAAVKSGDRLTHVITESKSGRRAFAGKVFIDATGDGDLGARAGCEFELGHPQSGLTQPMSLLALIGGVHAPELREFHVDLPNQQWAPPKHKLRALMETGGHSPSYSMPTLFRIRDDLFILMANHEYKVKAIVEEDVTQATIRARRELHDMVNALRRTGGVWKDVFLAATAEQIGIREARRLKGLYTVTLGDMVDGRRFDDAVCRATFNIDVHSLDPAKAKGMEEHVAIKPYDIPLRSLISRDVDGLLFAGRCISGDFLAHASYRVSGNAVPLGEAAGKAAAAAALKNIPPRDVKISDLG